MSNCRKGIIIMIIAGIFVFLSSFVYAQGLRLRKDMDAYDYYIQAKRLYEDGKYKQARDKFKQVLQIDPGYPWVNLYLEMIKQFLHEQDSLKTTTVEERKNFEKQIEKRKKQARKKKKRAKKKNKSISCN